MDEEQEIANDIAKTLRQHVPDFRITEIEIGPDVSPMNKPPTIYIIACDGGREIVYFEPLDGTPKAYDSVNKGELRAAIMADDIIDGINAEEIPIKVTDNLNIADEVLLGMDGNERDDVTVEFEDSN